MLAFGTRRNPARRAFALFLFAIAANQGTEALRAGETGAAELALARLASVFAALDPPLLLLAVSLVFDPRASWRAPSAGATIGVGALLALASLVLPASSVASPGFLGLQLAITTFTAALYTFAFARVLRGTAGAPDVRRLLGIALVYAALPVWPRVGGGLALVVWSFEGLAAVPEGATEAIALGLGVVALLLLARRGDALRGRRLGIHLALAASLASAIHSGMLRLVIADPGDLGARFGAAGPGLVSARWLLFVALLSVATLRHSMLDMPRAHRRRAARWLIAGAVLVAGAFAAALAAAVFGAPLTVRPVEGALLLAILLASQGFHRLVDRAVELAYGPEANGAGEPGPLRPGARVADRYHVSRLLGRGSAGRVYLATDEMLGREVALKELPTGDPEASRRALDEARAAGALHHPNVATIHDVIPARGATLLVLEYASGGSLASRLAEGPVPRGEGIAILDGVLAGLEAAHARGLVHGDVKPSNVLLAPTGAKLADFGVARLAQDATRSLSTQNVAGTLAFMAPERRAGAPLTVAADVYAAGLLGRLLLADDPATQAALDRACAPEPADRWSTVGELRAALGFELRREGEGGSARSR